MGRSSRLSIGPPGPFSRRSLGPFGSPNEGSEQRKGPKPACGGQVMVGKILQVAKMSPNAGKERGRVTLDEPQQVGVGPRPDPGELSPD